MRAIVARYGTRQPVRGREGRAAVAQVQRQRPRTASLVMTAPLAGSWTERLPGEWPGVGSTATGRVAEVDGRRHPR